MRCAHKIITFQLKPPRGEICSEFMFAGSPTYTVSCALLTALPTA